eukprot:scaffold21146_cov54-Attheya_sp.AAC.1
MFDCVVVLLEHDSCRVQPGFCQKEKRTRNNQILSESRLRGSAGFCPCVRLSEDGQTDRLWTQTSLSAMTMIRDARPTPWRKAAAMRP